MTWRVAVAASLAGKPWGAVKLDISPRTHELTRTDRFALPNLLDFAGVPAPVVQIVDVNRHAAEKLHAMCRAYGDRDNTRVRDLLDVVLLIEHYLLDPPRVARSAADVWAERDATIPPAEPPTLPASWPTRYERLAVDYDVAAASFTDAVALVGRLWADMFPIQEP